MTQENSIESLVEEKINHLRVSAIQYGINKGRDELRIRDVEDLNEALVCLKDDICTILAQRDEALAKLAEVQDKFGQHIADIPIGTFCPSKGDSYYNWGRHYEGILHGIIREISRTTTQDKKEPTHDNR